MPNILRASIRGTRQTPVVRWMLLPLALAVMGISMPSCPGQQALQHQLDGVSAKTEDMARRSQALEANLRAMSSEMVQVKTLLSQVSNTVLAQKKEIEGLQEALKTRGGGKAKAGASKKKR